MAAKKRATVSLRGSAVNKTIEKVSSEVELATQVELSNDQGLVSRSKHKSQVPDFTTIRDSFTMPKCDYDLIGEIKLALAKKGQILTKGEILRAGLIAISEMNDSQKVTAARKVDKIKVGRKKGE